MNANLQFDAESYKLLITGMSGHGKTTYWLKALLGTPAKLKFVFDHKGEVSAKLGCQPAYDLDGLAQSVTSGWCIYNPSIMFKGRRPEAFLFFCDFAFEVSCQFRGRKLFACDELQQFIGTAEIPDELGAVVEDGRIHGLDALFISSQPNIIHNRVRAQISEVVTFRHNEENAIAWLEEKGFDPALVRSLEKGEFICRNLDFQTQQGGRVF